MGTESTEEGQGLGVKFRVRVFVLRATGGTERL